MDEVIKNKENGRHADAARRKLEEQEDLYIEQQTAQQYRARETERQRKERQERDSIMLMHDQQIQLQQMAEEYLELEAKQQRKNMASASSSKPAEARGSRVTGGLVVAARATDARTGKEKEEEEDMVALATDFSPDSGEQVLSRFRMHAPVNNLFIRETAYVQI